MLKTAPATLVNKPKLLITGHTACGRTTIYQALKVYGFTQTSSAAVCCQDIVFPKLGPKFGYESPFACYQDRLNHRDDWYDLIIAYNNAYPARLGKQIFEKWEVYWGVRTMKELQNLKARKLFDASIYVLPGIRVAPKDEFTSIKPGFVDYIIYNDNYNLRDEVDEIMKRLGQQKPSRTFW